MTSQHPERPGRWPWMQGVDPRARLVACLAFTVVVAVSTRPAVAMAGLAAGVVAAGLAVLPFRPTLQRMAGVNLFMALMVVTLPFTMPGSPVFELGPLAFSREGLSRALWITVKANAIALVLAALVGTIAVERLGHAMARIGVPNKLTQILLFMARYGHLLQREHARLANAMKARGFRARTNLHTCRSLGYLAGMLLVRSFDRSERVLAAMKCRGFRGRYHIMGDLLMGRRDAVFAGVAVLFVVGLAWAEWA